MENPLKDKSKVLRNKSWNVFDGRLNRSEYITFLVILSIIISVPVSLTLSISETGYIINPLVTLVILLVLTTLYLPIVARRLHDLGYSGKIFCSIMYMPPLYLGLHSLLRGESPPDLNIFFFAVLLIGIILAISLHILLFKKGDEGENDFGMPINRHRSIFNALSNRTSREIGDSHD
jgi:uncharacterized membrane protein YhaH (DUF805 family)